ncbi:hypothetical protein SMMN14_01832 [Sphaerulina musiva]
MSTPTTTTNNPTGAQGEKAAEEIKGGIKGLNNLSEDIRQNINSFADDLLGGHNSHSNSNSHPSTGFSNDAKVAGEEVERKVGGGGGHATGQEVNDTTGTTSKTL